MKGEGLGKKQRRVLGLSAYFVQIRKIIGEILEESREMSVIRSEWRGSEDSLVLKGKM